MPSSKPLPCKVHPSVLLCPEGRRGCLCPSVSPLHKVTLHKGRLHSKPISSRSTPDLHQLTAS